MKSINSSADGGLKIWDKIDNDSLSDNSMDQKNYSFAHFKLPIGHTLYSISNDDNYCEYDSR